MARIDVMIPNYNYGRFLRDCLCSILSQRDVDLRVVVIDNASTDDSVAVARAVAAQDPRVEIVQNERNLGAQASFNKAIDLARAEYMMILCADDLLTPGALARAQAILDANLDVAFAYGVELAMMAMPPSSLIEARGSPLIWHVISGVAFIEERSKSPLESIAAGTVLLRTRVQKAAGHFDSRLKYTDDLEMLLRLAAYGTVAKTAAPQGFRRLHTANMSDSYQRDPRYKLMERFSAFRYALVHAQARNVGVDYRRYLKAAGANLRGAAYWGGARLLMRRRFEDAGAYFRVARAIGPGALLLPPFGYAVRVLWRRAAQSWSWPNQQGSRS